MPDNNGKCPICGNPIEYEGLDFCDKHLDDAMVLLTAIMKAQSASDVVHSWMVWNNGQGKDTTMFLDNCQNCGRLMWIARWERQKGKHGGKYCSRDCANEAKRKPSEDKPTPVVVIQKKNTPKNPDAVALGRLGGLKGGKARAQKLSPQRRSEIALNAVKTRWANQDETPKLTVDSNCPKCHLKALERDGTDLHCWSCGKVYYHIFKEEKAVA